jgi:membrane dipeptidase
VDYLVQRVGPEHVGLGLDYEYDQGLDDAPPGLDRAQWWPPAHGYGKEGPRIRIAAPEQFPEITAGLLALGYPGAAVRQILGANMLRLARQVWRPRSSG